MPNEPQRSGLKHVFIVGFPRSGTTWVLYLLSEHPAVVGAQQVGLFHALQPLEHWWHNTRGWGRRIVCGEAATDGGPRNAAKIPDAMGSQSFYDAARGLADRVYDRIAACVPGAHAVVDQTAENLDQAAMILRTYPDAYFLHVVRDPRAVCASLRKAVAGWAAGGELVDRPAEIARRWCAYDAAGRELEQRTERYRRVRYEDLLAGGGERLLDLYRWLDLPADRELAERAFAACSVARMRSDVEAPPGFIRRGTAGGWRDDLPRSAVAIVEYLAREPMQRLGYECVTRATAMPWRLRWEVGARRAVLAAKGAMGAGLRRRLKDLLQSG